MRGKCARSAEAKHERDTELTIRELKAQAQEANKRAQRAAALESEVARLKEDIVLLNAQLDDATSAELRAVKSELDSTRQSHDEFAREVISEFKRLWDDFKDYKILSFSVAAFILPEAERLGIEFLEPGDVARDIRRIAASKKKFNAKLDGALRSVPVAQRRRGVVLAQHARNVDEIKAELDRRAGQEASA